MHRLNIFCIYFLLVVSCSHISTIKDSNPSEISFYSNVGFDTLSVYIPSGHTFRKIPEKYSDGLLESMSNSLFSQGVDDSLKNILFKLMKNRVDANKVYILNNAFHSNHFTKLKMIFYFTTQIIISSRLKIMNLILSFYTEKKFKKCII